MTATRNGKRLFALLLALLMTLGLSPLALAETKNGEGEEVEPTPGNADTEITSVHVCVDLPTLTGVNHPEKNVCDFRVCPSVSTPKNSVTFGNITWHRCPKSDYGTANAAWIETGLATSYAAGFYYRVSVPITASDGYVFSDQTEFSLDFNTSSASEAHTTPHEYDVRYSEDCKSAVLKAIVRPLTWDVYPEVKQISNITATIAEPVLGRAPKYDFTSLSVADTNGESVELSIKSLSWYKISAADYAILQSWDDSRKDLENKPRWTPVGYTYDKVSGEAIATNEVFESGYYYRASIDFMSSLVAPPDSVFAEDFTLTLNGKNRTDFTWKDREVELTLIYDFSSSGDSGNSGNSGNLFPFDGTVTPTPTPEITPAPDAALPNTGDAESTPALLPAACAAFTLALAAFAAHRKRS